MSGRAGVAARPSAHPAAVPAVALGGALGSLARYGLERLWPPVAGEVPWATLLTNVVGSALLGALLVLLAARGRESLLRPFAGVGVLGGFTTFSTYAAQSAGLVEADRPLLAVGYLGGTLLAALLAVLAGAALARGLLGLLGTGRGRR